MMARVRAWIEQSEPASMYMDARSMQLVFDVYASARESAGISCVILGKEHETEARPESIRLATMHRIEGARVSTSSDCGCSERNGSFGVGTAGRVG